MNSKCDPNATRVFAILSEAHDRCSNNFAYSENGHLAYAVKAMEALLALLEIDANLNPSLIDFSRSRPQPPQPQEKPIKYDGVLPDCTLVLPGVWLLLPTNAQRKKQDDKA